MALRTGQVGPASTAKLFSCWRSDPLALDDDSLRYGWSNPSFCNELSTQNWSGQGESDSLIKTKHCDGPKG
jgi:hypothetical protein